MDRRVHQFCGIKEEKWLVFVFFDKGQCINTELMGGKSVFIETIRIVRLVGCETSHTMGLHSGRRSMDTTRPIEAQILWLRKGTMLRGQMPLTAMSRRIAVTFERLRKRD